MIFILNTPYSGIGQVTLKYAKMFDSHIIISHYDDVSLYDDTFFIFALPVDFDLNKIDELKKANKKFICMTVCETLEVSPDYGKLFEKMKTFAVPSEFCKKVFEKQFPQNEFKVIHHHADIPKELSPNELMFDQSKYIFYTICNALDQRKQVNKILKVFDSLQLENAIFVIKSTAHKDVSCNMPNVVLINGLVSDKVISAIHNSCHCYVNFSNSEGVGMGTVEAALYNKPIIMSDFGGGCEYVKTPFTIESSIKKVGYDDFLFTKDLQWGDPSTDQLMKFMKLAYNVNARYMSHEHTRFLTEREKVKSQFQSFQ